MALPKKTRTQENIANVHEGSLFTSRKEVEDLIMKQIEKLFHASEKYNDFSHPVAWSFDDFDGETLQNALHEIKGCESVIIDDCDSIDDIIHNNFKF